MSPNLEAPICADFRIHSSALVLALEEGDMLIISKKRSRRMLKGDEFETLIAADSDARGEHE